MYQATLAANAAAAADRLAAVASRAEQLAQHRRAAVSILRALVFAASFGSLADASSHASFARTAIRHIRCTDCARTAGSSCSSASMLLPASGCVRRRLNVRTNPPGALVYVDNQQIGTTPCSVDFTYYGTREIRLDQAGLRNADGQSADSDAVVPDSAARLRQREPGADEDPRQSHRDVRPGAAAHRADASSSSTARTNCGRRRCSIPVAPAAVTVPVGAADRSVAPPVVRRRSPCRSPAAAPPPIAPPTARAVISGRRPILCRARRIARPGCRPS